MDNNDRRPRQINPSGYPPQQGLIQTSAPFQASQAASDRYRQQRLPAQSPTSAPSAGRGNGAQGYGYSYGEGAQFAGAQMQTGALQYQSEYGPDSQRQSQAYQQYGTNMGGMYNVQSPQTAAPPPSPYEPVPPYQPRQSTAIEVLSTQFGVPQQYYVSGEGGPTNASVASAAAQNVQPQFTPMTYTTQSPVAHESMAPAYATGMTDQGQSGSSQAAYPRPQPPPQAGYSTQQQQQQSASQSAELDLAYGQYQQELRRTFECVRDGRLADAGTSLLHISEWLLSNAEALGLVRDDENMHAERLKLWEEFNTCWLTTLQRQKEMSSEMAETGQRPPPPQSLIEHVNLETMGKELVRLCDIMEKHGLVDYQLGVWEEDIINLLTQCLDLLEEHGGGSSAASDTHATSSQQRR